MSDKTDQEFIDACHAARWMRQDQKHRIHWPCAPIFGLVPSEYFPSGEIIIEKRQKEIILDGAPFAGFTGKSLNRRYVKRSLLWASENFTTGCNKSGEYNEEWIPETGEIVITGQPFDPCEFTATDGEISVGKTLKTQVSRGDDGYWSKTTQVITEYTPKMLMELAIEKMGSMPLTTGPAEGWGEWETAGGGNGALLFYRPDDPDGVWLYDFGYNYAVPTQAICRRTQWRIKAGPMPNGRLRFFWRISEDDATGFQAWLDSGEQSLDIEDCWRDPEDPDAEVWFYSDDPPINHDMPGPEYDEGEDPDQLGQTKGNDRARIRAFWADVQPTPVDPQTDP